MKNRQKTIALLVGAILLGALVGTIATSAVITAGSKKIRRTILLNFTPDASPADIHKVLQEVKENISQIKGVRNIVMGPQINKNANFQYGISMDFDDEAALKAYRQDEGHRETHNKYVHLIEQSQITDLRQE